MRNLALVVLPLLLATALVAAPKPTPRKPTSLGTLNITVQLGSRVTRATLEGGKTPLITWKDSRGEERRKELARSDYKFLVKSIKGLPSVSIQNHCRRSGVWIMQGQKAVRQGCLLGGVRGNPEYSTFVRWLHRASL